MPNHILSIILFTPLVGAFVLLFLPKENKDAIRWIANIFSLGGFLISLPLTLAVAQAVLVRAGERLWALPAPMVEQVQQVDPELAGDLLAQRHRRIHRVDAHQTHATQDERHHGGVERVANAFVAKLTPRDASQLFVHEGQHALDIGSGDDLAHGVQEFTR